MPKFKNFKARKGLQDQARNNQYVKIARQIFVEARKGGPDPNANTKLKSVIASARAINMPMDNIDRAIKKAAGNLDGVDYESVRYEGYGPGGVAVLVECLTDNRNRSSAAVRSIFTKRGGSMGEPGCVAWMFDEKGLLEIDREEKDQDEDALLLDALEAGADDLIVNPDSFEVITGVSDWEDVKSNLEGSGYQFVQSGVKMIPQNTVKIAGEDAVKMLKMMDAFEENDDVQEVYVNFEIDDDELERIQSQL